MYTKILIVEDRNWPVEVNMWLEENPGIDFINILIDGNTFTIIYE